MSSIIGGRVDRWSSSTLFPSLSFFLFLVSSVHFTLGQTTNCSLGPGERAALKEIGSILGKKNWNFSVNPCSGLSGWVDLKPPKGSANDVQCTRPNTTNCYVSSILLQSQGLAGTLPKNLTKLQHLGQLDLTRNYLNGTIPKEWAALRIVNMKSSPKFAFLQLLANMNLSCLHGEGSQYSKGFCHDPILRVVLLKGNISLMGNRLSGPIPKELGSIITLKNISLEGNQLSGNIPPQIGNLTHLERLVLSSNNFSGELPQTLERLRNMTDFRISDNAFSGKFPEFIGKWTSLTILDIQGTNLMGPIPPGISSLTKLSKLVVSGISGTSSKFPDISKMTGLKTLVLRNCMLSGQIPEDIGALKSLKILDLSFNNLTGEVPKSLGGTKLPFLFLTNNSLTGSLTELRLRTDWDFSYNNFTNVPNEGCLLGSGNFVKSVKAWEKDNIIHSCLRGSCNSRKPKYLSFHVNCGSNDPVTVGDTVFEGDDFTKGAAVFFSSKPSWASSNTGTFLDNDIDDDKYTVSGNLSFVPEAKAEANLYTNARISPISLKYYGLCLYNGLYTVKLYFAEIVITNDKNFSSLGNRIFDVYIQGKLEKKDFNIKKAAGMSGKAIVLNFTSVNVTDNTLEIHFFWDGKGTTGIPERGVYGPLVSAISVEAEFSKPKDMKVIIAVVSGLLSFFLLILLVVGILWKAGYLRRQEEPAFPELDKFDLQTGSFTLRQIKAATMNFDAVNKIGEGGFGSVYRGHLSDGTVIAVKQLSAKSKQGSREFITEIGLISGLQHPNLVKLYGCCTEGRELLLVYEYMENNSLAHALFGRKDNKLKLDWPTRRNICIGIARGLAYLHEESTLKIVHRDIKCTNILLDKDLNAKISDFGLAKLDEEEDTHISTRIAGTFGYMAPEYAMRGHLTYKADVYSFGVVALEIVSGKSNASSKQGEEGYYLLDEAFLLQDRGNLLKLVDPELGSNYSKEEAMIMLNVALHCTNSSPSLRPTMSIALSMLEGRLAVKPLPPPPASSAHLRNRKPREFSQTRKPSRSQSWSYSHSMEMQWTGSSISGPQPYDDSEHLLAESSLEIYQSP